MNGRTRFAWVLVLTAATAVWAVPSFAFDEVFQQTYPLPAGGTFQLQNVNGTVQVTGWERNEVEVRAVKSAKRDPRDAQRVRIEVETSADSVSVATRYPQDGGVEVVVEYRVRVPHRVVLKRVATVNGAVRISGVDAAGELRSVNGNIEVFDSSGGLSAYTTNGNVRMELEGLDPDGPMSIETVNGSVVLGLPVGIGAELDARSVNGDLRSELPLILQGTHGSREFRGRLGPGGSTIRIRTVNGGIRVVTTRPTV